jgi:exonuclease SbcD
MQLSYKDGDGVNLVLLPYRDRRMYAGRTVEEDSKLYDQEVRDLVDSCQNGIPTIAVGHNFFLERSYSDYGGHEIMASLGAFENCDMVTMGHLHQFRIVRKKKPIAIYSGSMEKLNFGDEKVDKYFLDYNTKTRKTKVIKCPSRPLKDICIDLVECTHDDIVATLDAEIAKHDLQDMVVRAKVIVKDNLISLLKKNNIEKGLYDRNAFYVSKIMFETIIHKIVRDNAILQQTDDISMFEAFLDNQNLDEALYNEVLSAAKGIIV